MYLKIDFEANINNVKLCKLKKKEKLNKKLIKFNTFPYLLSSS